MKKILFIEDEFTLQNIMGKFLEKEGYEIIHAFDGEIGLRLAEEKKPDLILLDLVLPKLNGFEVLKKIKKKKKIQNIPVIVLTNLGSPEDIKKILELGATTFLIKADQNLKDIAGKIKYALRE